MWEKGDPFPIIFSDLTRRKIYDGANFDLLSAYVLNLK